MTKRCDRAVQRSYKILFCHSAKSLCHEDIMSLQSITTLAAGGPRDVWRLHAVHMPAAALPAGLLQEKLLSHDMESQQAGPWGVCLVNTNGAALADIAGSVAGIRRCMVSPAPCSNRCSSPSSRNRHVSLNSTMAVLPPGLACLCRSSLGASSWIACKHRAFWTRSQATGAYCRQSREAT